ncbi:hypothetical protein LSH36_359g04001 [Paralvinella palmiformis]|uniref:Metalloprotease TIKI homolog n=1 Tax=Paralvinella palmiformis TaxID=53620 RepID=A0AAD9JE80_9ANNE|nr:hypothetical protein LSH36_359g04001 [Paralvinella palmiformis]
MPRRPFQNHETRGVLDAAVLDVSKPSDDRLRSLNEKKTVLFALNHTLWKLENSRFGEISSSYTTEDLIRHYNCGNLDTVLFSQDTAQVPSFLNMTLASSERATASEIDGYFREQLIYRRNQRMGNRINELLTENPNKSFFFAFGAVNIDRAKGDEMSDFDVYLVALYRYLEVAHTTSYHLSSLNSSSGEKRSSHHRDEEHYKRLLSQELQVKQPRKVCGDIPNDVDASPAGHFLGNNTVLHALAERGYQVTHVAPEEQLDLGCLVVTVRYYEPVMPYLLRNEYYCGRRLLNLMELKYNRPVLANGEWGGWERYQRRRRKFPPLLADLEESLPPPVINDNLEYLDLSQDRRTRTRHRHGGAPGGRRRTRPRTKAPSTSDNERIKYPQFNDLWVRLEASSFGPDNVFGIPGLPTTPQVPVYAMYNGATRRRSNELHILLPAVLLCSRYLLHHINQQLYPI